jgi:hypothetical protein
VLEIADRRVDLEDGQIVRFGVRTGHVWSYASERDPDAEPASDVRSRLETK